MDVHGGKTKSINTGLVGWGGVGRAGALYNYADREVESLDTHERKTILTDTNGELYNYADREGESRHSKRGNYIDTQKGNMLYTDPE